MGSGKAGRVRVAWSELGGQHSSEKPSGFCIHVATGKKENLLLGGGNQGHFHKRSATGTKRRAVPDGPGGASWPAGHVAAHLSPRAAGLLSLLGWGARTQPEGRPRLSPRRSVVLSVTCDRDTCGGWKQRGVSSCVLVIVTCLVGGPPGGGPRSEDP